jgi:hypothetical protein
MKVWDESENEPRCKLTHDLINQLTVLTIYCGLLNEEGPLDPETQRRLYVIRAAAQSIADELSRHECETELIRVRELAAPRMPS